MHFKRAAHTAISAASLLLALCLQSSALAAELPCKTAKLIVPWGAGGGTDVIFRIFENAVNASGADPQIQVVNIPG